MDAITRHAAMGAITRRAAMGAITRRFVVLALGAAALVAVSLAGRGGVASPRRAAHNSVPQLAASVISRDLGRSDRAYFAVRTADGFSLRGPRRHLSARFVRGGAAIQAEHGIVRLRLSAVGFGSTLGGVAAVAPRAQRNRVVYRHGLIDEWYANGPLGIEQGFTVRSAPSGAQRGPLTLVLALGGNARAMLSSAGTSVSFLDAAGHSVLSYSGLVVTDARGRKLNARLALAGRRLLVRVDAAGARYPLTVDPYFQTAQLTASNATQGTAFGFGGVALGGDTIVAGAPGAAAYVFVEPSAGWANATETAELSQSSPGAGPTLNDRFATSVAISADGNTIAVGDEWYGYGDDAGAVYVYTKPPSGWTSETQSAILTDASPGGNLGLAVAVSADGDTIAAGAPNYPSDKGMGAVMVYERPASGWHDATENADLTTSDQQAEEELGLSVAISGNTIVSGAPGYDYNPNLLQSVGAAYVFVEPGSGWQNATESARLTASAPANQGLGFGVAISGNTIAVGAPGANSVYVYQQSSGWHSATETAILTAAGIPGPPYGGSAVGQSVAIQGATIAASAPFAGSDIQGALVVWTSPGPTWSSNLPATEVTEANAHALDGLGGALPSGVGSAQAGLGGVAYQNGTLVGAAPGVNNVTGAVDSFNVGVPVTVTGGQTYGSSSPSFTSTGAAPSGDSFSGTVTCTTVGSPAQTIGPSAAAGSYTINGSSCSGLSLSGPTATDYTIIYTGSTFNVSPAPLTVNAPSASAYYAAVPATFTPTYTGLQNGSAAPSTPATCTSNATNTSPPGAYTITCAGASDPNYTISYGPAGGLTITKAPTKLAAAPAKTGLLSSTFSATLTRADNAAPIAGKTVVFSIQGQHVCQGTTNSSGVASCKVVGVVITLGQATYSASYAGDADYLASSGTGKL